MSAWIISLPVVVGLAATILFMVAAGLGTYQIILRIPAGETDDSDRFTSMVSSGAASYAILQYLPLKGADESATRVADHIRRVVGVLLGLMLSTVFAFSSAQYVKNQDSIEVEAAHGRPAGAHLGVLEVGHKGLHILECAPGVSRDDIRAATEATIV